MPYEPSLILAAIIILALILYLSFRPRKRHVDVEGIHASFGEDNLLSLSFERERIRAKLKDNKRFDAERLKAEGAKGINIVGDTVKFYFDRHNEAIYHALNERLGKRGDDG